MILSGGDLAAVTALVRAAPGVRMGYDPCHGGSLEALKASGDFAGWIAEALAAAPGAELIYLAYEIVTAADDAGVDLIGLVHAARPPGGRLHHPVRDARKPASRHPPRRAEGGPDHNGRPGGACRRHDAMKP